jgi:hypothetical protein
MAATWALLDSISVTSVQAATEAAPSLDTDGMPLQSVLAISVYLDAGAGQTITSDAGQADIYVFDNFLWGPAPALVLAVPPGSSGQRRVLLGTVSVDNQRGRVAPILNGVTVSGATANVDVLVTLDRRGIAKAA